MSVSSNRDVQTALILPVPEIDQIVDRWRLAHDPARADGIGAHVTISYPWLDIDVASDNIEALAAVAARIEPVEIICERVDWFGDDVLWIAPDPSDVLVRVIEAFQAPWPDHPMYGFSGVRRPIVPHITVGYGSRSALRDAERAVRVRLPTKATIAEATIMAGRLGETWTVLATLAFGSADSLAPK